MTEPLTFTVYGVAQPAGSKRAFVHQHTKRVVVTDDAKRSRPWKQEVAGAARAAMDGIELYAGPLELRIAVLAARPLSHFGKRGLRDSAPVYPVVRPDLLKLARAIEDALTGIVYRDDAQIITEHLTKRYDDAPRVEITVTDLTPS
jgi:Holliday junction resolvase RusA-like endonuclease